MGIVAQELREFDQAREEYQQALQIFIEFGDRYTQAITYSQLGLLAEALNEMEEAIWYFIQDYNRHIREPIEKNRKSSGFSPSFT